MALGRGPYKESTLPILGPKGGGTWDGKAEPKPLKPTKPEPVPGGGKAHKPGSGVFDERTVVTPAKTRTLPDINFAGFQEQNEEPLVTTKTIETQKELIDVRHDGQFGEAPKGKDWVQPSPRPKAE